MNVKFFYKIIEIWLQILRNFTSLKYTFSEAKFFAKLQTIGGWNIPKNI